MEVRVEINGREYTLSWEDFERRSARNSVHTPITILQIRMNGGGKHGNA
jgi:hypothetical protein